MTHIQGEQTLKKEMESADKRFLIAASIVGCIVVFSFRHIIGWFVQGSPGLGYLGLFSILVSLGGLFFYSRFIQKRQEELKGEWLVFEEPKAETIEQDKHSQSKVEVVEPEEVSSTTRKLVAPIKAMKQGLRPVVVNYPYPPLVQASEDAKAVASLLLDNDLIKSPAIPRKQMAEFLAKVKENNPQAIHIAAHGIVETDYSKVDTFLTSLLPECIVIVIDEVKPFAPYAGTIFSGSSSMGFFCQAGGSSKYDKIKGFERLPNGYLVADNAVGIGNAINSYFFKVWDMGGVTLNEDAAPYKYNTHTKATALYAVFRSKMPAGYSFDKMDIKAFEEIVERVMKQYIQEHPQSSTDYAISA